MNDETEDLRERLDAAYQQEDILHEEITNLRKTVEKYIQSVPSVESIISQRIDLLTKEQLDEFWGIVEIVNTTEDVREAVRELLLPKE
jgi:hypothetical protein